MIRVKDQKLGINTRKSFSSTKNILELPNLIEVQTKSFQWFLDTGLNEVLKDVSPIKDHTGNYELEFLSYSLDQKPRYSIEECKERDVNYATPLKVRVRLTNTQTDERTEVDIFMGEFPLMTETGTFVINGAERVIVSQIIRSPGMYYSSTIDKMGNKTYAATVIPYRGAWLEYETDATGTAYVRIDKTRKLPLTMFIRALGLEINREEGTLRTNIETKEDIYGIFGKEPVLAATLEKDESEANNAESHSGIAIESLKEIYKKLRPGEPVQVDAAITLINNFFFDHRRYDIQPVGRYKFDKKLAISKRIRGHKLAEDVFSVITGELLYEKGTVLTEADAVAIQNAAVNTVMLEMENGDIVKVFGNNTIEPIHVLGFDLVDCGIEEKVKYPVLQAIMEEAAGDVDELKRLCTERVRELCPLFVTKDDILASINYFLGLTHDIGSVDDIDHLGNRRIRSVGEQLQNQMRIGFTRMEKTIKERMATQDSEKITPQSLVNIHPITKVIREFFGSSQLSQFMDQANPLAELTHKRRLSALGPGGISRDRASFDVRDVHYTHYGRMCPIETPEGPNIGLISYLSTYARINKYGFIEAPYRKVDKETHRVTDEVIYMTADVEDKYIIAQGNEPLTEDGYFVNRRVIARDRAEIVEVDVDDIDFMDVSPKMVFSVATASIPFLENDDNSRALMGSNMQKQAVPLMVTDSPIVGTGMEHKAAVDSGVVVVAKNAGIVDYVDAQRIVILTEEGRKDTYDLLKFKRTNQGTCFNQRPLVFKGDKVEAGQVIADGPATSRGEVSLGKNALIGFMTWEGYNYEDAVLLNEKLVRNDVYTSLHIEVYTHEARETKLGSEEITSEIPNVAADATKNLNDGVIMVGTEVHAGDILVGKITPKGDPEPTAEERLLRAIFGEKARETRDTSLRLPHGESGIVVAVRTFSSAAGDDLPAGVNKVVHVYIAQKRKISVGDKMAGRHGNKGVVSRILPPEDMPFLADGTPLDIVLNPLGVPSRMNIGQVLEVHLGIAARKLGWKIMTPVFDGANEEDIVECLKEAGIYRDIMPGENVAGKTTFEMVDEKTGETKTKVIDGKTTLYDGRTGEPFDNPVTVGIMYYLKLHHLVDDKIHARSFGPYSLVTQQPLGGKAQFGGQRFGEMEVWALEAYGAAYTLQEILTVKSDDTVGRRKAYEAIIKGQNIPTPGVPESFRVLVQELRSLGLDVNVLDEEGKTVNLSILNDELGYPQDKPRKRREHREDYEDDEDDEIKLRRSEFHIVDTEGNILEDEEGLVDDDIYDEEAEEVDDSAYDDSDYDENN